MRANKSQFNSIQCQWMIRPKKANELTGDSGGTIFDLFIAVLTLSNLIGPN